MYEKRKIFLLVATLIVLLIGITAISATNTTNDQSTTITKDNTQNNNHNVDVNAVNSQLKTTKKIDTKSVVEKPKKTDGEGNTVRVTNLTFNTCFTAYGTQQKIKENDTIILEGLFTDKDITLDKKGLTVIGNNATIQNGQVYINEIAVNSVVRNLTIIVDDSAKLDSAIFNEAANVTIYNNTVSITNTEGKTYGIENIGDNVIIANNNVTVAGPALTINWDSGENKGLANTLGIVNLDVSNVLVENNTVFTTYKPGSVKENLSTIDSIEIQKGNNITINNNTVYVSDARFVYAINALEDVHNIIITNNKLYSTSERYADGIQIGNNATDCIIENNTINCKARNTTIFTGDDEALTFGIITTSMGKGSTEAGTSSKNITIKNNKINLDGSINYGMEIYQTSYTTITKNDIKANGNKSMGIAFAHSPNSDVSFNKIETNGDTDYPTNDIVEEILPNNYGIRIQQNSNNIMINNNSIVTNDKSNKSKTVNINKITNVTVIDNTLKSSELVGDESVEYDDESKEITVKNNSAPVVKKDAIITFNKPADTQTNQVVTLVATIKDSQTEELLNGRAVFKLNGVTLKDENGNAIKVKVVNGSATLNYTLEGFGAYNYKATVVFGNDSYNRVENDTVLTVTRVKATIENITFSAYSGQKVLLNTTLVDENGKVLSGNNKIVVKINGKTIKSFNSINGTICEEIDIPSLNAGESVLTIIVGENSKYEEARANSTITILKDDADITINNITAKPGEFVNFTATIFTKNAKIPVSSGSYGFKLNGITLTNIDPVTGEESKTLNIKNTVNGTVFLTTYIDNFIKDGEYDITVTYSGNGQTNEAKVTEKALTIKA